MSTAVSGLVSFDDGQGSAQERVNKAREKLNTRDADLDELRGTDLGDLSTTKQQAALLLKVVSEVAELYNQESKKAGNGDMELKGHMVSKEGVELVEKATEQFVQLTRASAQAFDSASLLDDFDAFVEKDMPVAQVNRATLQVAAPQEVTDKYEVTKEDLANSLADASGIEGWQISGKDAQVKEHNGKVRENYTLDNNTFVSIATDRMSARNVPNLTEIPYKGQILTSVSNHWAKLAKDIGETYGIGLQTKEDSNDPNTTIAHNVTTLPVEVVLRRHLTGTAFKRYQGDKSVLTNRVFGDHKLADGIKEHQRLDTVVVDPTTKGKDDIPVTDAQARILIGKDDWYRIKDFSTDLFEAAEKEAAKAGIILADTKFEFGRLPNGDLVLIDEVLTPDSSRYWFGGDAEGSLNWSLTNEKTPISFDKDPIRHWVDENTGKPDSDLQGNVPEELTLSVANRYVQIHDLITGKKFIPEKTGLDRVKANLQAEGYLTA